MSFDPSLSTARDRLRQQLGDTSGDEATELMPDVTYNSTLAYNGNNEIKALIAMAEAMIAKYSQSASRINLGDMEFSWRDRLTGWRGILTKFSNVTQTAVGGGFQTHRPEREEIRGEYERPYEREAWFNDT